MENEVESTALLLSGTVTDLWLTIQEQRALLDLFQRQIEINRTQLELLELRFSVGESLALDVFQQRLQLVRTEAELPPVHSRLRTANQELATLLGEAPKGLISEKPASFTFFFPPFPKVGKPVELLWYRPDLKAAYRRLFSAEREIAEAMRDRFPKFLIQLSYDFQAEDLKKIFDQEILTLIGQIITPIIDGGKRKAEVKRRRAIFQERLHFLSQKMLTALLEVENAITEEKEQKKLLEQLETQKKVADQNLMESQFNYSYGLNDYLTVIAAIQAVQNVEGRIINEKRQLFSIRSRLYRALGGCPLS